MKNCNIFQQTNRIVNKTFYCDYKYFLGDIIRNKAGLFDQFYTTTVKMEAKHKL